MSFMSGQEIERMTNYDELSVIILTNPKYKNVSFKCQNVAASSDNPGKEGRPVTVF